MKRIDEGERHPSHDEVEGETQEGGGFVASGADDDADEGECPLEGEDGDALGGGEGEEGDGGVGAGDHDVDGAMI